MSDKYSTYLLSLHQDSTPDPLIAQIILTGTSQNLISKERIISGEENEVYKVVLDNHQTVILRIAKNRYPDFLQEQWVLNQCAQIGIPVPKLLSLQHLDQSDKQISACILEYVDGQPLDRSGVNFWNLDRNTQKKYIAQAGMVLSQIHSIKTTGYGEITAADRVEFQSSDQLIDELISKKDTYSQMEGLSTTAIKRAFEIVDNFRSTYRQIPPCLNHADYSPKHFMVRNEQIISIIDWGDIRSDLPHFDFANLDYWYCDSIPLEWLKEGYTDKSLFNENFDHIIHTLRIFRGLAVLRWYHHQQYTSGIQAALVKFAKDLKYFD